MRSLRIAILWIIGILLWVFGLTIGLAWFQFGFLDWKTIATMGVILVPVLGVAIGVLVWTHVHEAAEEAALKEKMASAKQLDIQVSHQPILPHSSTGAHTVLPASPNLHSTRHITSHS